MQYRKKKNKGMQIKKEEGNLSVTDKTVVSVENSKESIKLLKELIHELGTVTGYRSIHEQFYF